MLALYHCNYVANGEGVRCTDGNPMLTVVRKSLVWVHKLLAKSHLYPKPRALAIPSLCGRLRSASTAAPTAAPTARKHKLSQDVQFNDVEIFVAKDLKVGALMQFCCSPTKD